MTPKLFHFVTLALKNNSKNVLLPYSIGFRKGTGLWRTTEVRFFSGVADSIDAGRRERHDNVNLSLSELGPTKEQYDHIGDESRLLKIAIIGVPNVGKSTVINHLVGRRVCSISSKVHTTRCKARAISIEGNTQFVFLDTPGLVNSDESRRHKLEHAFHTDGETAMLEADTIGVVHDVSNTWLRDRLDPKVLRLLHLYPQKPSFLVLNKIDILKSKRRLLDLVHLLTNNSLAKLSKTSDQELSSVVDYTVDVKQQVKEAENKGHNDPAKDNIQGLSELQVQRKVQTEIGWSHFEEIFMVSALFGSGMKDIKDYLLHISKPSPWLYPPSKYTDQPSETVIVATVQSKLLDHLPQEIPYNLTTTIEYFDVGTEGAISAVVLVVCPTFRLQKLVVGSRGLRLRAIVREAEQELQSTFRQLLRLKVFVTNKSQPPPTFVNRSRKRVLVP